MPGVRRFFLLKDPCGQSGDIVNTIHFIKIKKIPLKRIHEYCIVITNENRNTQLNKAFIAYYFIITVYFCIPIGLGMFYGKCRYRQ